MINDHCLCLFSVKHFLEYWAKVTNSFHFSLITHHFFCSIFGKVKKNHELCTKYKDMEKKQDKQNTAVLRLKKALEHKLAWKRELEEEFSRKGKKVTVELL